MHDIRHLFASNPCIGEIKRANPYEEGICFYANGERQKDSLSLDVSGDHAAGKRRILKAGIQAQRSVLVARHSDSLLDEFIDCIPRRSAAILGALRYWSNRQLPQSIPCRQKGAP
jgi:hypothetical protein